VNAIPPTHSEKLVASTIWVALIAATISSLLAIPWESGLGTVNRLREGGFVVAAVAALMRLGMTEDRPRMVTTTEDDRPRDDGRWRCLPGPDLNRPAGSLGDLANDEFDTTY
jgi:hypothetical protein